jgi:hypothetical protein
MTAPSTNVMVARHVVTWICLVCIAFVGLLLVGGREEQKAVNIIPQSTTVLKTTNNLDNDSSTLSSTAATAIGDSNSNHNNKEIVQGLSGDVPYYHCAGTRTRIGEGVHKNIVLLHGSRFTKEDWKTSGILQKLCDVNTGETSSSLSVTAIDLNVNSNHQVLKQTLFNLAANDLVRLPITAIVTPSASGLALTDWLQHGVVADLQQKYVKAWIPVASPSIRAPTDAQLAALALQTPVPFPVLAIYGSKDGPGKQVSQRLERLANAVTVELQGGHPCYLDSPDAFVENVWNYVRQIA